LQIWANFSPRAVALVIVPPYVADAPLNYLTAYGTRAHSIQILTWALLLISIIVLVIISILLIAGLVRGSRRETINLPGEAPVSRPPRGASWIYIGVGASTIVLFAMSVWTMTILADVTSPPVGKTAVHIEVTAHQWWWEVRYLDKDVSREFITANEIHIPIGQPVEVELRGPDVIHSGCRP
jgi:cytochrome c oxidase subunit II